MRKAETSMVFCFRKYMQCGCDSWLFVWYIRFSYFCLNISLHFSSYIFENFTRASFPARYLKIPMKMLLACWAWPYSQRLCPLRKKKKQKNKSTWNVNKATFVIQQRKPVWNFQNIVFVWLRLKKRIELGTVFVIWMRMSKSPCQSE